jgi:hypothetical protein
MVVEVVNMYDQVDLNLATVLPNTTTTHQTETNIVDMWTNNVTNNTTATLTKMTKVDMMTNVTNTTATHTKMLQVLDMRTNV